ncbi:NAD(P)-dependent alcohol dehydrogenase [Lujinxingia vulgaris]|uniref:NAD(P)-dependent alcohol dehydrogenase n=1 Tax=Lujinxingia vulgaris TaxID=2600176 RepID=A0A5C6XCI3_9DELT|nr:NAD(P)-dependent alcohol dehydrogenase [Lujinxingia vulgaris]TXD37461.1 NAD(P)-dependent alcohol dehydrogenase [Lujinxingia vulgaris]
MKAVTLQGYGDVSKLMLVDDAPEPACAPNQVVIKVAAASLNPLDTKTRNGELRWLAPRNFPLILGNDASGTIVRVGSEVTDFEVGDEVFCMVDANASPACNGFALSGSHAEYVVTRADTLSLKPENISHTEAAAVPLAALTAYQALVHKAQVRSGDRVLINGASGGVGTFALQLAVALGAEVSAVCGPSNADLMTALGAAEVIDYTRVDFCDQEERYDVIYDVVANRTFGQCCHVLTPQGVYVRNVATLAGFCFPLLHPAASFFGYKKRFEQVWVEPRGEDLQEIADLLEDGLMRPIVGKVFPLAQVAQAHDIVERGSVAGKTVLSIAE